MKQLRAVIFDLDNTLISSRVDFRRMRTEIMDLLLRLRVPPNRLSENMLISEIVKVAVNNLRERGFTEEEIKNILTKIAEIMNRVELESLNENLNPMENAVKTLKRLKELNLKVGVITNSCREYAERALAKLGLRSYIDSVVARDYVEEMKPNPKNALHLLNLLGVNNEEAVFIGDHWLDAECARRAGIRFILIERGENPRMISEYNCRKIGDLWEIIDLIESGKL